MSEQADRNRATVLRLMEALNVCDADTIRSIMPVDADWWVLGIGTLDRDTVITQLEQLLGSAKVAETHILGTTAEGDRVAVESRGNFEFADGRVYCNSYHHLFTLRDGQVVGVREYLDLLHFQSVFGA
jgi:uncharacterized protein